MYGDAFKNAFGEAYHECRNVFSDTDWEAVWRRQLGQPGDWNHFMMWVPPLPQTKCVLSLTAERMGLVYVAGNPFHLDGAFKHADAPMFGSSPLPTIVAIEHENNVDTLHEEVVKLAQVRCALKVGITYTERDRLGTVARLGARKDMVQQIIARVSTAVNALTSEDVSIEYVVLLGHEERPLIFDWYALHFNAGTGPQSAQWAPISG